VIGVPRAATCKCRIVEVENAGKTRNRHPAGRCRRSGKCSMGTEQVPEVPNPWIDGFRKISRELQGTPCFYSYQGQNL